MKKTLLMLMAVVMVGCASSGGGKANKNAKNLLQLKIGQTKETVLKTMGQPEKTEAYKAKDNRSLEFWFYLTSGRWMDHVGRPMEAFSDKHYTPLCFVEGKLEGWGRNFYDDTIKIRKEIIRKP
jgi:hypothetical protein